MRGESWTDIEKMKERRGKGEREREEGGRDEKMERQRTKTAEAAVQGAGFTAARCRL